MVRLYYGSCVKHCVVDGTQMAAVSISQNAVFIILIKRRLLCKRNQIKRLHQHLMAMAMAMATAIAPAIIQFIWIIRIVSLIIIRLIRITMAMAMMQLMRKKCTVICWIRRPSIERVRWIRNHSNPPSNGYPI